MPFVPSKVGEVIVPINPSAIVGLDPDAIADGIAPHVIRAARQAGGHPYGQPEILREDELRTRTDDPALTATIDRHPGRLWLVCRMIPMAQADEVRAELEAGVGALEVVAPSVRFPRRRPARR